ncbi:hypothetical protein BUY39_02590 [Staphylococcus cohnii]|uniref:YrhK family protein n=2 Tax=Staphylococcus TaxID=1279 RepID=UPI000DFCDB1D|nr:MULTISPECIES: YrhK family protein [Staphylococcus]MCE5033377.1 YrhK family protein [Staphylococcus cohnii]RIL80777.1 hypothetical protein BUY39_02590 [Staphylococcus cohnii]SUM78964.1 Uncharacterised protein [Staphylococcus cohnii]
MKRISKLGSNNQHEVDLQMRHVTIKISAIYKLFYQLNDLLLGIIFLIGSFFFFNESTTFYGTILFVIGSIQMLIRPIISIIHDIHINKVMENEKE